MLALEIYSTVLIITHIYPKVTCKKFIYNRIEVKLPTIEFF